MKSNTRRRLAIAATLLLVAALGIAFVTRDVTRLRLTLSEEGVSVERDIVYVDGSSHPKHRLDVYMPEQAAAVPVVHFIHGGYWTAGDKDFHRTVTGLYGSVGVALAHAGVGAVVQSYRLAPEVNIDVIIDDVMSGLRWTQQHIGSRGGDVSNIFVMGHSAGGHLAALLASNRSLHDSRGMDASKLRGCITLSAVFDIGDMKAKHDDAFDEEVTRPTFGADPTRYPAYSPLTHLRADMPPLLVLVGSEDYPYLLPQAQSVRERMEALGKPASFVELEGNDHDAMVLRFGSRDDNVTAVVVDFVKRIAQRR